MTRLYQIALVGLLFVAGQAGARDLSALKASPALAAPGTEVSISVEVSKGGQCGVLINHGDGTTQELRIDADAGATVSYRYQKPGNYAVTIC